MDKKQFLKKSSRRRFIRNSVVGATSVSILPTVLSNCSDKTNPDTDPVPLPKDDFIPEGDFGFFEGVASFDPTQNKVVLWSRYTPAANESSNPEVILEVATDLDFKNLTTSEPVVVDANSDNTVSVDVSSLISNTKYYYRFSSEKTKAISIVGETKTLPSVGEVSEVKIAVVSCANYELGYFNVYGALAESEADFVVHLGDYIYENSVVEYGNSELAASMGREHEPPREIISLDDYRSRYRQYRGDEQLQKAHQLKPFICVWDDHEFANDAYKDGAGNHQADEGSYSTRKMNAIQAWYEYLPARVTDNTKIYRSFDMAGIVHLMMLDTRIVGRDKQLNYNDYMVDSELDKEAFLSDWQDPDRSLLGKEQLSWLTAQISSNNSKWQVIGSQVLMGKYHFPEEILSLLRKFSGGSRIDKQLAEQFGQQLNELISIKNRIEQGDPDITPAERARVENVLPFNLDYWDGYPIERAKIFEAASGKKLIDFAGASHNAWHTILSDDKGKKVGAEFATTSITSSGLEKTIGDNPVTISVFEQTNIKLIDDLLYSKIAKRGYILATFSDAKAEAEWKFAGSITTKDASTISDYTAIEE